tara:strand:+ start:123 stop:542 length:420 start_codon:yes stop_codon:yes gene_type:complete
MDKYLIFHASGVDSSSVTSHDTGTDIDLACFPASAITAIMGEEDMVYIYFKDATRFETGIGGNSNDEDTYETMEQSYVRLTVIEGKEIDVVKDLTTVLIGADHISKQILFDAVNNTFPIDNVTAIQIRRHLTTHTIASD